MHINEKDINNHNHIYGGNHMNTALFQKYLENINGRTFLDDSTVANIIGWYNGTVYYGIKAKAIQNMYPEIELPDFDAEDGSGVIIADSVAGRDLLKRYDFGTELYDNTTFVELGNLHGLKKIQPYRFTKKPGQVIIASGGWPSNQNGFKMDGEKTFKEMVNTLVFRVKREKEGKGFKAKLRSEFMGDLYIPPDQDCHLKEDCTASGSSLICTGETICERTKPKKFVTSLACGSMEGLSEFWKQICKPNKVGLLAILAGGLFGVYQGDENDPRHLTELSGLHPRSILTKEFFMESFFRFQGQTLCSIGDYGERIWLAAIALRDFILEMMEYDLNPALEDWTRWPLTIILSEEFKKLLCENSTIKNNGKTKELKAMPEAYEYMMNGLKARNIPTDANLYLYQ